MNTENLKYKETQAKEGRHRDRNTDKERETDICRDTEIDKYTYIYHDEKNAFLRIFFINDALL